MTIDYKKEVRTIPEEELFWSGYAEDTFADAMQELIELGMNKEEALAFLGSLYYATAACYGD